MPSPASKLLAVLALCAFSLPAFAGELLLAAAGKSAYQIVLPDQPHPDKQIQASIEQAGKLMVQAFAAQGVTVPLVRESAADAAKPAIHIGLTQLAKDHGVSFAPDNSWTYTFKVVGKNLLIAGNDQPDPMPLDIRRPREARQGGIPITGTLKGVCEFLTAHMGARFLTPGDQGLVFLEAPILFVPDNLDITQKPWALDMEIPRSKNVFQVTNGLVTHPLVLTNYGHYHHTVFDAATHGKTNPEYFIWRAGKRQIHSQHYCFSNPQVRELIYQKVLADCDAGYQIIEMGQNDGWIPCDCKECYNLYDIHPTHTQDQGVAYLNDAAWAEKLWIMHRDMAQRLMVDRPGHFLMLSAYAVARNPPVTFSSFPPNVIIQVMHPDKDIFAAWNKLDIPGGYAAYLYTWGSFHLAGYTPLRSLPEIKELVDVLVDNDVRLIQINGKPTVYGIEGANIYALGRMLNNPAEKPIEEHFKDYIDASYQEAAGPMQSFYRKLHQRLMFMPQAERYARYINRNPLLLFSTLYTPDFLASLDEQLNSAEKKARSQGVKDRLAATRLEFEYLKQMADTITWYHAWLTEPTPANHTRVLDAVDARNQWITSLANDRGRVGREQPSFNYIPMGVLKSNGRFFNVEPFNWDVALRRQMGDVATPQETRTIIAPQASKPVTIDSDAWKSAPVQPLSTTAHNKHQPLKQETTFQVLYDQKHVYIRVQAGLLAEDMTFDTRGRDPELWLQESINIQLSTTGDKSQYYYLSYDPVPDSFSDAQHGFITDPLHPQFGWNDDTWNGQWSYVNHLDKAANKWVSMVTIPHQTLGANAPRKGESWLLNVARIHYSNQKKDREIAAWAGEANASKIPGDARFGELSFE